MKKLVILLAVILSANVMMAQKTDRTNAFMYNKNGQFEKAAASIEKCVNHDAFLGMKPKDQAQAWLYRGMIYLNIHQDPELAAKYPDALEKAYVSLQNCVKADPDFTKDAQNAQEVYPRIAAIAVNYFQSGVDNFNNQVYPQAGSDFRKAYEVSLNGDAPDNSALVNAAMSYQRAKMYNEALACYDELKLNGYEDVDLYKNMAACYTALGDQEQSLVMIQAGLDKYPGDAGLIIEKVNVYLSQNRGEEAVADLQKLHDLDPENPSIMFVLGTIYGEETSVIYDADKAVQYYTQAIKLNPDYYDAIYNLGVLYIGMSNKLKAQANEITGFSKAELDQVDSLMEQAKEYLRQGLPYIKQAYEAQPSDDIKHVLKTMYVQLNMLEEAKALE